MSGTWVVIDHRDGNVRKVSLEILSEAKRVVGGEVAAVAFGKGADKIAEEVKKFGADKSNLLRYLQDRKIDCSVAK